VREAKRAKKLKELGKKHKKGDRTTAMIEGIMRPVAENLFGTEQREREETKEVMASNNILLKYDALKQNFHFVEHPVFEAKEKERRRKEAQKKALARDTDVVFDEGSQKIVVKEVLCIGPLPIAVVIDAEDANWQEEKTR
jgi:hypothetical protein